jgi:hypothetical protein
VRRALFESVRVFYITIASCSPMELDYVHASDYSLCFGCTSTVVFGEHGTSCAMMTQLRSRNKYYTDYKALVCWMLMAGRRSQTCRRAFSKSGCSDAQCRFFHQTNTVPMGAAATVDVVVTVNPWAMLQHLQCDTAAARAEQIESQLAAAVRQARANFDLEMEVSVARTRCLVGNVVLGACAAAHTQLGEMVALVIAEARQAATTLAPAEAPVPTARLIDLDVQPPDAFGRSSDCDI